MKTRADLHRIASEIKLGENWAKYKYIRNKINYRSKYEESVWQKARLEACGDSTAKT